MTYIRKQYPRYHTCRICGESHRGEYAMCESCQKTARPFDEVPNGHHMDCPQAYHDKGSCMCSTIYGRRYA